MKETITKLHSKTSATYALFEHGAAISYAVCEYASAHYLVIIFAGGMLLLGTVWLVLRVMEAI